MNLKHPILDLNEFNEFYVSNLLVKPSKVNKALYFLGYFKMGAFYLVTKIHLQMSLLNPCLLIYFDLINFNQ